MSFVSPVRLLPKVTPVGILYRCQRRQKPLRVPFSPTHSLIFSLSLSLSLSHSLLEVSPGNPRGKQSSNRDLRLKRPFAEKKFSTDIFFLRDEAPVFAGSWKKVTFMNFGEKRFLIVSSPLSLTFHLDIIDDTHYFMSRTRS